MGRLLALLGGVAWLAAIVIFAAVIQWSGRPRVVPSLIRPPPLVRELNRSRLSPAEQGLSWVVTRATSAQHILVVDVDAERPGEARAIATQIVEPVIKKGYDEILVYVWRANGDKVYADRRIQWTPRGGYTELVISD